MKVTALLAALFLTNCFAAAFATPLPLTIRTIDGFGLAGRGRIVAVNWSDARSGAMAFIRRYGWSFPVLRDSEGTVGNDYRLPGLPTSFVVDGRGRIRRTLAGPQTQASLSAALRAAESS